MTLPQFFIGIGLTVTGVAIVRFAYWLHNYTGPQDWLEQYTGPGTTMGMYKLFGVFVAIAGLLTMTGLGTPILRIILEPLSGLFRGFSG